MNITLLHGYPDRVGKRFRWCGNGNGPASYVGGTTPGDQIILPVFQAYIDSVNGDQLSVSGNYIVRVQPGGIGARQKWFTRWFNVSGGAEVTNATNLSAEQVQLSGDGGLY